MRTLDSHPLVREYFAEQLKTSLPEAWRAGHERLYHYFKDGIEDQPTTLERMMPLYAAVAHGCAAGRHKEAFEEVYWRRISRRGKYPQLHRLGAFSADLGAVSAFFIRSWSAPAPNLTKDDQSLLLTQAGYNLRSLGRLTEAVEPMRAGLAADIAMEHWSNAAASATHLSELQLIRGDLGDALSVAQQGIEFADRSTNGLLPMIARANKADALHQAGRLDEAEALFREAEALQRAWSSSFPLLYSLPGYQYSDFLLSRGLTQEVLQRQATTLSWANEYGVPLDIALQHLALGLAQLRLGYLSEADTALQNALEGLRQAGAEHHVPRGLLARAELDLCQRHPQRAWAHLEESLRLTTRSGMRLLEADTHLGFARWHLHKRNARRARDSLDGARAIIKASGYCRRDSEVDELEIRISERKSFPGS
jgi:tetratricopeptide (TPR) repeat protein